MNRNGVSVEHLLSYALTAFLSVAPPHMPDFQVTPSLGQALLLGSWRLPKVLAYRETRSWQSKLFWTMLMGAPVVRFIVLVATGRQAKYFPLAGLRKQFNQRVAKHFALPSSAITSKKDK